MSSHAIDMRATRILVLGAGVIGRVYAARMCLAGFDVTLVARDETAARLAVSGVTIADNGDPPQTAFPRIVTHVGDADDADLAFIAVRRDQVAAAGPAIRAIRARIVVSLIDLPLGLPRLARIVGAARFVPGFPGVGGTVRADGVVEFVDIAQQPTSIQCGPHAGEVRSVLHQAGFRTVTVPDMTDWLQCHAIFVAAFESAIVALDGDLATLASDRRRTKTVVLAVREGLNALQSRGAKIVPTSIGLIFLRMPVWFATRYWLRQLAGPVGRLGFQPHSMASRAGELPALRNDIRALTAETPTPRLDRLLDSAQTS